MAKVAVRHKSNVRQVGGVTHTGTLCRFVAMTDDGMNVANTDDEVTCRHCLRKMAANTKFIAAIARAAAKRNRE